MNRSTSRAALAVAMFAVLLAACGGEDSESAPPETASEASPSPAVAALSFYMANPRPGPLVATVAARLQTALVGAGYNLVAAESAPHNVTARLAVTATPEQSLFQVTVNGTPQTKMRVHVTLSLTDDGRVVDELAHDFDSTNGEVSGEDVTPLVARLGRSPRLARYARELAGAHEARARASAQRAAQAEQEEAAATKAEQDKVDADEQSAWQAANADACAEATTLTACNDLQTWLKSHPNSPHAQEATQTLDAARPKNPRHRRRHALEQRELGDVQGAQQDERLRRHQRLHRPLPKRRARRRGEDDSRRLHEEDRHPEEKGGGASAAR